MKLREFNPCHAPDSGKFCGRMRKRREAARRRVDRAERFLAIAARREATIAQRTPPKWGTGWLGAIRRFTAEGARTMYDDVDDAVEDLLRESDAEIYGTADYDTIVTALREKWSDAARAASAAARKARRGGGDWRKAARTAYVGSRKGVALATRSQSAARKRAQAAYSKADYAAGEGGGSGLAFRKADKLNARAARNARRFRDTAQYSTLKKRAAKASTARTFKSRPRRKRERGTSGAAFAIGSSGRFNAPIYRG